MTPRYFEHRRRYTDRNDKYLALLAQGFDESAARRMADSPDIPQIYGPTRKSKIIETYTI